MLRKRKHSQFAMGALFTLSVAAVGTGQNVRSVSASIDTPVSDRQVHELQDTVLRYDSVFGGLWADPETGVITISLVPGASTSPTGVQAMDKIGSVVRSAPAVGLAHKSWRVQFDQSPGPSLSDLKAAMAKVATAQPWATDVGSDLVSWYVDARLRAVVIGLTRITPVLESDAQKAFGGLARLVPSGKGVPLDRWTDSQAYYQSDHITLASYTSACTSGFAAYDPNAGNNRGVLTAGHCYANNTVVSQGYYSGGHLYASGNMGKVTRLSFANNYPDVEFLNSATVGTSVSDFVWRGPNPPTGITKPSGVYGSYQGLTPCFDGAFTGENCSGQVKSVTMGCLTITLADGRTNYDCNMWPVTSRNGSALSQSGDSGGPVFNDDGFGGLKAYGTITALEQVNGVTTYWYTDLNSELNTLGVRLIVN